MSFSFKFYLFFCLTVSAGLGNKRSPSAILRQYSYFSSEGHEELLMQRQWRDGPFADSFSNLCWCISSLSSAEPTPPVERQMKGGSTLLLLRLTPVQCHSFYLSSSQAVWEMEALTGGDLKALHTSPPHPVTLQKTVLEEELLHP